MQLRIKSLRMPFFWQRVPVKPLPSIPTAQDSNAALEPTSQADTPLPPTYHHKCETLIYKTFTAILTGGPLTLLTISGEPTENQLQVAWELILQDYSELINTPKAKSIFDIWMKIVSTKRKLSFIDISIEWLKVGYDAEIAEQLCSLGYDLVQPLTDRAQYLQQLYVIQNEAKLLVVLLNQYVSEYNALSPNDSKIVARTAMDYEKELRILSKFMGYHIKATDITVFEFAGIVNSYIELNKKNGTTI